MTSLELLACLMLIFMSAFMGASEIALFSLSRFQLRALKEDFRPIHRKIKRLLADPAGILITILVVNEVVNISISSLITEAVSRSHFEVPEQLLSIPRWILEAFLGILVSSPIILLLCEVTPKVIASKINQLVATATVGPLSAIYDFLKPVRFLLRRILGLFSSHTPSDDSFLRESDFLMLVEEGHKEGAIQESELELIRNVFQLDSTTVGDIYTPLSQVLTLPSITTVSEALTAIRSQRYSRIPITGINRKEIVGILYSKDLLRSKLLQEGSLTVANLMRKPFFASPTLKLDALFRKFKLQKNHMAIVKSAHGEISGIVTMSDILDTLFENLYSDAEMEEP